MPEAAEHHIQLIARATLCSLLNDLLTIMPAVSPAARNTKIEPAIVSWKLQCGQIEISFLCSLRSKRSCSTEELQNDFPQTGPAKVGVRDQDYD